MNIDAWIGCEIIDVTTKEEIGPILSLNTYDALHSDHRINWSRYEDKTITIIPGISETERDFTIPSGSLIGRKYKLWAALWLGHNLDSYNSIRIAKACSDFDFTIIE